MGAGPLSVVWYFPFVWIGCFSIDFHFATYLEYCVQWFWVYMLFVLDLD